MPTNLLKMWIKNLQNALRAFDDAVYELPVGSEFLSAVTTPCVYMQADDFRSDSSLTSLRFKKNR